MLPGATGLSTGFPRRSWITSPSIPEGPARRSEDGEAWIPGHQGPDTCSARRLSGAAPTNGGWIEWTDFPKDRNYLHAAGLSVSAMETHAKCLLDVLPRSPASSPRGPPNLPIFVQSEINDHDALLPSPCRGIRRLSHRRRKHRARSRKGRANADFNKAIRNPAQRETLAGSY